MLVSKLMSYHLFTSAALYLAEKNLLDIVQTTAWGNISMLFGQLAIINVITSRLSVLWSFYMVVSMLLV